MMTDKGLLLDLKLNHGNGKVILNFGMAIKFLSLDPQEALALSKELEAHSFHARFDNLFLDDE